MKTLIIAALALVSASAFARPNTANMSCRDAAGLVAEAGKIVLSTNDQYNLYVTNGGLCGPGDLGVKAYVETLDNDACFVGYVCETASRDLPASKWVKTGPKGCKEGATIVENSRDFGNKTFVCHAGKYVQASGPVAPAPVYRACKEGTTFTNYDRDFGNKTYSCIGGKYVQVR